MTGEAEAAPTVALEINEDWARLVLDRPGRLNAFNAAMHAELQAALAAVAAERSVRALVLTGRGRGFCTGQDLTERSRSVDAPPPDLGHSLSTLWNPLIRRLRSMPCPVVAAVNGVAAGAGANVALACDIVIAARSAKFIQSFSKVGLIPDSGGTHLLPRLVGTGRAYALAALAEPVTADEAERWGMIFKAVDDAELEGEAARLAGRLAALPTDALVALRTELAEGGVNGLDAQLDREARAQARLGASADYREGVAAFLEKRPPRFALRSGGGPETA